MAILHPPKFENEKLLCQRISREREELTKAILKMNGEFPVTIPIKINGPEAETKQLRSQVNPSRHRDIVANYAVATPDQVNAAVDAALKAKPAWEATPFEGRAAIFLRACELITGKYRSEMVAATMLGQGKNIWQAEIDALAETLASYNLAEAGLPKDVIQFLPGDAEEVTNTILKKPEFGALTFIGSTATFKGIQKKIGDGIGQGIYNSYPRVMALNTICAAFEYQGQKCSANSRVYLAESIWPEFRRYLKDETEALKVGNVEDYRNFIKPVIHERSFDKLSIFIDDARSDPELELVTGGKTSKEEGYYVQPTIYRTSNPRHEIMSRELFGPILDMVVSMRRIHMRAVRLKIALKHAAGMLYLNSKCTGSTVARQPFGGSRDSGGNDKSGTMAHLQSFVRTRTIKEDFVPLEKVNYPSNETHHVHPVYLLNVPPTLTSISANSTNGKITNESLTAALDLGFFNVIKRLMRPALFMLNLLATSKSPILNADRNGILKKILRCTVNDHFRAGTNHAEVSRVIADTKRVGYQGVILGYSKEIVLHTNDHSSTHSTKYSGRCYEKVEELTGAGPIAVDAMAARQPMPESVQKAVDAICITTAQQSSRLRLDAELQVLQPGLDKWAIEMMRKHNRPEKPVAYNTNQSYLKEPKANVDLHIALAAQEGWSLGIKLVRGAYIEHEIRAMIHDTKEIDQSCDLIADALLCQRLPAEVKHLQFSSAALFLATHNAASTAKAITTHRARLLNGQPTVTLECGQIQGMADELICELLQEYESAMDRSSAAKVPVDFQVLDVGLCGGVYGVSTSLAIENRGAVE
ncbi:Delta-1-pyrroline-5-carboxylate dehydrogenase, mitochondrial [Aspergillus hancockii]|nr:Delta-1-pyrroline-5-carboxylate dehydrogenase, mitochondrial [Aspergillus hancockii]